MALQRERESTKKRNRNYATEIKVIRSRQSLEIGTNFFSSTKFCSQLKEEKGQIKEVERDQVRET